MAVLSDSRHPAAGQGHGRRLIEEALRREAGKRLLNAMARLREANVPPLTEEEDAEEVASVRAARKATGASGH